MRPQPYIGVTGFMLRQEVDWVLKTLPEDFGRLVMIGVLVSGKTLHGQPNKWPNRYPKGEVLKTLFPDNRHALNLIHFNTKEPERLLYDMCLAQDLCGSNCHGFQLNIAWPDKKVLQDYKAKAQFHHKTIVLQVGGKALDEMGRHPTRVMARVQEYAGLVDYVLIDPSGGLGKEFELSLARNYLERQNIAPDVGFGIAGGLHGENIERLRELASKYEFSIDAEGKLRNEDDHLDVLKTALYLQNAGKLFRELKQAA